jgi:hypothetical protein
MTKGEIDTEFAARLLNRRVLVGINFFNGELKLARREQYFGVIESIDTEGVSIRHPESGESFVVPPDLNAFRPAEKGRYRMRTSGEVVDDPDFTAQYDVYQDVPATDDDLEK